MKAIDVLEKSFMLLSTVCAVLLSTMCVYRGHQLDNDVLCYVMSGMFLLCAVMCWLTQRDIKWGEQ